MQGTGQRKVLVPGIDCVTSGTDKTMQRDKVIFEPISLSDLADDNLSIRHNLAY